MTELAWHQAVNDTANLWQSILCNTFGPVQAAQIYGIPAAVTDVGKGLLCWRTPGHQPHVGACDPVSSLAHASAFA